MTNPYLESVLKAKSVHAATPRPETKREPSCLSCGQTLAAQMKGVCMEEFCPYNLN